MTLPPRRDAALVVAGPYHDMDHARLALLGLMAEHEALRTRVTETYDPGVLDTAEVLVTYTCNLVPDDTQTGALERFLARGGRWLALHGTNSLFVLEADAPIRCPPLPEAFRAMLGSQFAAHPRPGRFEVRNVAPHHPLTAGIDSFIVEDEQYLQDHDPGNEPLLVTDFEGDTPLFERRTWPAGTHQVMYLRRRGPGAVLYLTLGHTRGRYDMRPLAETYPFVERGSWPHPTYRTLLRRGLLWAMKEAPFD